MLEQLPAFVAQVLRLSIWLVLLSALFIPLERWCAVAPGAHSRRERLHDLAYYFASSLLPALVLSLPLALIGHFAHQLMPAGVQNGLAGMPLVGRVATAFLVGEVAYYWAHRLTHQIPALWQFHAVHHSPQHLYFLVNTRAHPVDLLFTRFCALLPLYVLGLAGPTPGGSITPVSVILVGTAWGFLVHSNVRLRLGALEWLISSPHFHHWHHSRFDHVNHNYAAMLPLIDRFFGTLHLPREWPADYGIDVPLSPTLRGQLADPLQSGSKTAP